MVGCLLGILQPGVPSPGSDLAPSNPVQFSHVPEQRYKSPEHSISSLVDSGCFRSPSDQTPSASIMDDFDALLLQLKCLGNMDFGVSGPPDVRAQHTVPYFPPITSALRRERGMFDCWQSSCVEYIDDEAVQSPRVLTMSCSGQHYVGSLADLSSALAADFQPFQSIGDLCWQSCPDVSDHSAPSATNVEQRISSNAARFDGLNSCHFL